MDTDEELIHKKKMSLDVLQGKLNDAKTQRPDKSKRISVIEEALELVDKENYIEKFESLDVLVAGFIADANNEPPNTQNNDWLNRLISIRNAINEYKHAYTSAAHIDNQ